MSTWVCVGSFPHTFSHSWECESDSQVTLLTCTFPCPYFNYEPKIKVLTFFLPYVPHSFLKLERMLTLMIRKPKGFVLMKIIFIINLNTFGSKVFLHLKIMDFDDMFLTKVVHVHVVESTMYNIHDIKSICSQNVFMFKM
jgi:hypothetical protein